MAINTITSDVLVIGAGIAGLRAAIQARRYDLDVIIAEKSTGRTNLSSVAGGTQGIVMNYWSLSMPTSLKSLFERGVKGGAWEIMYGKDQRLEEINAVEQVPYQDELAEFGVLNPRDQKSYGPPGRMGWATTGPMWHYVQDIGCKLIKFFNIADLLTVDGEVVGAVGFDVKKGDFIVVNAKAVVMATGGAGECWARNNTPVRSTGDGHAIAYRNGVEMNMMEYESFDAWIISEKGQPQYWIPPSYARTMVNLTNANGEDFLPNYITLGPDATLKPGDPFHIKYGTPVIDNVATIARAMANEVYEGRGDEGGVLCDFRHIPEEVWMAEPKGIAGLHAMRNFDWKNKPIHMYPGALGSWGGIKITEDCYTSLPGLFAGGEVSYGEDLKYSLVFGVRAGRSAAEWAMDRSLARPDPIQVKEKKDHLDRIMSRPQSQDGDPRAIRKAIQEVSMEKFGVLKTEQWLLEGLEELANLRKTADEKLYARDPRELRLACEVDFMFDCQEMHARAALLRTETRGVHNRLDYPYMDNDLWIKDIRIKKINGEMNLYTAPTRKGAVKIPGGRIPIKGLAPGKGVS
ncbi:MAG: FAD-binding protein [Deltaproteobacteria bacterium]|nr:FAD-binding protein [Deltaproteobacteria bacterium]MBW2136694.1 FAD-binding protein [Deltaproteobacteria bacterium]